MDPTILFASPTFSVWHDAPHDWLYVEWCGPQDRVSSCASCELLARSIAATHPTKLLCDSSLALDGWDEISQWVSTDYLPFLAGQGIGVIAWVTAKDWTTKAHLVAMIQQTTQPFVATFEQLASAYEWLQVTRFPAPVRATPVSPRRQSPAPSTPAMYTDTLFPTLVAPNSTLL